MSNNTVPLKARLSSIKRRPSAKRWLVIVFISVLLFGIAGVSVYRVIFDKPILNETVVDQADFPVYAPATLPAGYRIDESQTAINQDVLVYTLVHDETNARITATVQQWPTGFNISKIVSGGSIETSNVDVGTLYDLSTDSSTQYLLDAGNTLIFLTSTQKIAIPTINTIVDNLKKIN